MQKFPIDRKCIFFKQINTEGNELKNIHYSYDQRRIYDQ